jgi:hypothetical protein
MDTNEPTIVINNYPTIKEQVVQAGIGLGIAAATTLVMFGTLYIVGTVVEKKAARKAKKNQTIEQ